MHNICALDLKVSLLSYEGTKIYNFKVLIQSHPKPVRVDCLYSRRLR